MKCDKMPNAAVISPTAKYPRLCHHFLPRPESAKELMERLGRLKAVEVKAGEKEAAAKEAVEKVEVSGYVSPIEQPITPVEKEAGEKREAVEEGEEDVGRLKERYLERFGDLMEIDLSRDLSVLDGRGFDEALKLLGEDGSILIRSLYDAVFEDVEARRRLRHYLKKVKRGKPLFREFFKELDTPLKVRLLYSAVEPYIETVRVVAGGMGEEEIYVLDGTTLRDPEPLLSALSSILVGWGYSTTVVKRELKTALFHTPRSIASRELNPWDKLNLASGVLDLNTLRLEQGRTGYFTYRLDLKISQEEVDEVACGSYDVTLNPIYKLWRGHFDDANWEYFIDSVGTWLSPYRFRHVAFLVGPRGIGKSTLLTALTRPIRELVAFTSLRSITGYVFGMEGLVGKQIVVYNERGETILKNLDILNTLFGENDYVEVHRKHRPAVTIRSMKAGMYSMNDPPVVSEYGGETMAAFCERLSLIDIKPPEDFTPVKNINVDEKDAFKFLLWCRVQLEQRGWEIRKLTAEDVIDRLVEGSNPVRRFLNSDYVVIDPQARCSGGDLYNAYVKWSGKEGIATVSRNAFYSIVATRHTKYMRGKMVWFKGIRPAQKWETGEGGEAG